MITGTTDQTARTVEVAHPQDASVPLQPSELDELQRRLSGEREDIHPAHTRAWALVAVRQLRARAEAAEAELASLRQGDHR